MRNYGQKVAEEAGESVARDQMKTSIDLVDEDVFNGVFCILEQDKVKMGYPGRFIHCGNKSQIRDLSGQCSESGSLRIMSFVSQIIVSCSLLSNRIDSLTMTTFSYSE
jgi:hypothetical protein